MKLATAAIAIAAMAISVNGFSREKKLEEAERRELQDNGGRHLKSASTLVSGSASIFVPAPTPPPTHLPVISASASTILSGSGSVPVTAPTPAETPIAPTPGGMPLPPSFFVPMPTAPSPAVPTALPPTPSILPPPSLPVAPTALPPPATSVCRTIPVYFLKRELRANYTRYGFGGGFDQVAFYNAETGEQYGYYSDEATNLDSGDCVGSGVFSFGPTINYLDQITFSFSCYGASNTITGGNGRFGCASGYEIFGADEPNRISSTLYLCGGLCPYSGPISPTDPRSEAP